MKIVTVMGKKNQRYFLVNSASVRDLSFSDMLSSISPNSLSSAPLIFAPTAHFGLGSLGAKPKTWPFLTSSKTSDIRISFGERPSWLPPFFPSLLSTRPASRSTLSSLRTSAGLLFSELAMYSDDNNSSGKCASRLRMCTCMENLLRINSVTFKITVQR